MTSTEIAPLDLVGQLDLVERVGAMKVKGYRDSEVAEVLDITPYRVKQYYQEYQNVLQQQADNDPYFLERIQFNTLKGLAELDDIGKEAWETVEIATQSGMVTARVQALKLALDISTKKMQLMQLLGGGRTGDSDTMARMTKAEQVNALLSRVIKEVVSDCPQCQERSRVLLAEAFAAMQEDEIVDE